MAENKPFEITTEEVDKISNALKDAEFRKLFCEYAQEISDPENKKLYEEELAQLEKERGVDVKFLKPTPGFVLRSYILPEGKEKVFVNVCQSELLKPATSESVTNSKGRTGESWNIPYSLTTPREDFDKEKTKCSVIDAVFHPDTYKRGQQNTRFKQLLVDTALDGIDANFKMKLDRKRVKQLKLAYKGILPSTVIRSTENEVSDRPQNVDLGDLPLKVPYPLLKENPEKAKPPQKVKKPSEPRYTIVYSGEFSMQDFTNERESSSIKRPRHLIVTIRLPGVESASSVELDIYEKRLTLECAKPLYKLDLALSYPVDEDKSTAKFDKAKNTLTVTLPVLPPPVEQVEPPCVTARPLVSEIQSESESVKPIEDDASADGCLNADSEADETNNQIGGGESCDAGVSNHVTEEWTSVGDWFCPPFSYRQDESSVTFVLYTPEMKKKSLVLNFDQNCAHLTYTTATDRSYSFYVSFSEGCDLEIDDCVVDISEDNAVLLLTKDTKGMWEKFIVGLNANQTTEKLFLTEANVQSVVEEMEKLPDPWMNNNGWSESSQVIVTSITDTQLDVTIVDQPPTDTDHLQTSTNLDKLTKETTSANEVPDQRFHKAKQHEAGNALENVSEVKSETKNESDDTGVSTVGGDVDNGDGGANVVSRGDGDEDNGDGQAGSFVKIEDDGSVFVRADKDYVQSKSEGKMDLVGGQTNTKGGIQFSNKLMYSLD